jgi:proteasome lid subunit RPN8/RPN11
MKMPIALPDSIVAEIRAHAAREYPRESCGLVIVRKGRRRYITCRNIADKNEHFVMHPEDQAAAEDQGEIVMVVHSHPNVAPRPSHADLVGCEQTGVPWLIVNWPTGVMYEFAPSGYVAPLIGRQFAHGILDCYSLIKDYFRLELQIELPDFERADEWWLRGQNLYLEGFEKAGFIRVDGLPQKHDGLLMQVSSPVPNHAAVYLGENRILHHQMNRLSSKDIFGGWYQKVTTHVLRHRSLV